MIGVIGISHKTALVNIREKFSLSGQEITDFISSLKDNREIAKFVILSTCNRMEIYFYLAGNNKTGNYNAVLKQFVKFWKVDNSIKKYFYSYYDIDAVKHLFSVASGTDAMIIGEDQILGQVKNAYKISAEKGFTGPVLNRLFHKSFEVGKKVRTETAINEGMASVSSVGAGIASNHSGDFEKHSVLLIGAGETGELVIKSLLAKGYKNIFISNRTFEKAGKIAEIYNCTAIAFEKIKEQLAVSDIVVISTASKDPIITHPVVSAIMPARNNRPLLIIDLSVPRNAEPEIEKINNVTLYDIDHIQQVIKKNISKREKEIVQAEEIINAYTHDFFSWMDTLDLTPAIKNLKEKFDSLNSRELEKCRNKYSSKEFEMISEYGSFITEKFANLVARNLMELSDKGNKAECIDFVNDLFGLDKKG